MLTFKLLTCDSPSPYTGRIYAFEEVEKMMNDFNARQSLGTEPGFGILVGEDRDFCDSGIPISKISHRIHKLYMDGKDLMAEVELFDTPAGDEVKQRMDSLRLSPAMVGECDDNMKPYSLTLIRTDFLLKDHKCDKEQQ